MTCLLVEATEIFRVVSSHSKADYTTLNSCMSRWSCPNRTALKVQGSLEHTVGGGGQVTWGGGSPGHREAPGNCVLSACSTWFKTIWKIIPDPCGYREEDYRQILLPNFYLISVKCNLVSQLIFILVMISWGGYFHILQSPLVSYLLCICVDYLTMLTIYSIFVFQILLILSGPDPMSIHLHSYIWKKYLYSHAYRSIIHNSQDMETPHVSNNSWMDKEDVIHT